MFLKTCTRGSTRGRVKEEVILSESLSEILLPLTIRVVKGN